jgi:hypothetical protein
MFVGDRRAGLHVRQQETTRSARGFVQPEARLHYILAAPSVLEVGPFNASVAS